MNATPADTTLPNDLVRLERADRPALATRFTAGDGPTIMFLPGYASDMSGGKATSIFDWAQANGHACILMDYAGCGLSDGQFRNETLESWQADARYVLNHYAPEGQVILVGSSMGGWQMLTLGLALGDRLAGLVGIASAPDFTEWGFDAAERATLQSGGFVNRTGSENPHDAETATLPFWESGQRNLLLNVPIAIDCPVALLHGMADEAVPWQISVKIAEQVRSPAVRLYLVKDGDHRLSRDEDIALLVSTVATMATRQDI